MTVDAKWAVDYDGKTFAAGTTFLRGTRITVRDPSTALCKMIRKLRALDLDRWQGDRVSMMFLHRVQESTFPGERPQHVYAGILRDVRVAVFEHALSVDTTPSFHMVQPVNHSGDEVAVHDVAADELVVVQRRKAGYRYSGEPWRNADLTFVVNAWPAGLEAARDAILEGRMEDAVKCARQIMPFAWPLYVDVTRKEQRAIG
jgi:hypothetical protein